MEGEYQRVREWDRAQRRVMWREREKEKEKGKRCEVRTGHDSSVGVPRI